MCARCSSVNARYICCLSYWERMENFFCFCENHVLRLKLLAQNDISAYSSTHSLVYTWINEHWACSAANILKRMREWRASICSIAYIYLYYDIERLSLQRVNACQLMDGCYAKVDINTWRQMFHVSVVCCRLTFNYPNFGTKNSDNESTKPYQLHWRIQIKCFYYYHRWSTINKCIKWNNMWLHKLWI